MPGKLFDVKTTQYFVGFGRTLWSRRKGETEYGIKAIPLGGYVRFVGMYPPAKEHPGPGPGRPGPGIFQRMADKARAAEWEDIRPEDDGRLFYQKKSWQKLIIMAGGPIDEHAAGLRHPARRHRDLRGLPRDADRQPACSECIVGRRRHRPRPAPAEPKTPGFAAGLRTGDRIVAFNGTADHGVGRDVQRRSGPTSTEPARSPCERDGQQVELPPVNTVITGVPRRWDPSKRVAAGLLRRRSPSGRARARRPGRRRAGHVEDDPADRVSRWSSSRSRSTTPPPTWSPASRATSTGR